METNIVFKDFEGFDHLRGFVDETVDASLSKYENHKGLEVKVIVGTTHARHQGQPPEFVCEALIVHREKNLFAKKTHTNFQTAVRSCVKALEKIIRRETEKKMKIHRQQKQPMYESSYETTQDDSTAVPEGA